MLSNVLYSKWCGTIAPALYYIFQGHKYAIKIYYLGLGIGVTLCGSIQLLMKHQMEKHFVEEQPAYVQIMRDPNQVNNWFVALVYALLGGVVVYIVYTTFPTREPDLEDKENEDTKKKLKFVEVFIKESSKNYNKMF